MLERHCPSCVYDSRTMDDGKTTRSALDKIPGYMDHQPAPERSTTPVYPATSASTAHTLTTNKQTTPSKSTQQTAKPSHSSVRMMQHVLRLQAHLSSIHPTLPPPRGMPLPGANSCCTAVLCMTPPPHPPNPALAAPLQRGRLLRPGNPPPPLLGASITPTAPRPCFPPRRTPPLPQRVLQQLRQAPQLPAPPTNQQPARAAQPHTGLSCPLTAPGPCSSQPFGVSSRSCPALSALAGVQTQPPRRQAARLRHPGPAKTLPLPPLPPRHSPVASVRRLRGSGGPAAPRGRGCCCRCSPCQQGQQGSAQAAACCP